MPAFPFRKTYVPSVVNLWVIQCKFITKHYDKILQIVALASPDNLAAFKAGLDAAVAVCGVIQQVGSDVAAYDN